MLIIYMYTAPYDDERRAIPRPEEPETQVCSRYSDITYIATKFGGPDGVLITSVDCIYVYVSPPLPPLTHCGS